MLSLGLQVHTQLPSCEGLFFACLFLRFRLFSFLRRFVFGCVRLCLFVLVCLRLCSRLCLFMFAFVFVFAFFSGSVSVSVFVFVFVRVGVYLRLSVFVSLCVPPFLFVFLFEVVRSFACPFASAFAFSLPVCFLLFVIILF